MKRHVGNRNQFMKLPVRRVFSSHELWIKTNGKAGKKGILENIDFHDEEFPANLLIDGFVFKRCKFYNVVFDKSVRLSSASFENCSFHGCSFRGVNFQKVTFYACSFFGGEISESNFADSRFSSSSISGIKITDSSFMNASFSKVTGFSNCNFQKSSFFDVALQDSFFVLCDFRDNLFNFFLPQSCHFERIRWFCDDIPWWLGHRHQSMFILYDE